jgi:hypothetical protein
MPDFCPFPAAPKQRSAFLADLIDQSATLALHAHTALPLALGTHLSDVDDFYQSRAFGNHRKGQEARQKYATAVVERFDGLAKQIGGLGKMLAHAMSRRG